jgi:hypothetical protein
MEGEGSGLYPLKPCVGRGFWSSLSLPLLLFPALVLHALSSSASIHRCYSRLKPVQDFAAEMSNWTRSNISREQLLRLVEAGQLPPLTEAMK